MTIALLCNQYPPARDGVGDYTAQLASALIGQGIAVHVIYREAPGIQPVTTASQHPIKGEWGSASKAQVLKIVERIKPDWVSIQYVPYGFDSRGLPFFLPELVRAIRHTGVLVSVMFHEVHVRIKGVKGRLLGVLQRQIAKELCREADRCFTSIEYYRNLLAPFRKDIRLLPVGSNIPAQAILPEQRAQLRRELFPEIDCIISTFGQRDLTALFQAVSDLEAAGHKLGLLICGHTMHPPVNIGFVKAQFTGYLPAPEISKYLQCSDLFVLPDYVSPRGEGGSCNKSGSLAAAYAVGLPVIGTLGDMNSSLLQHRKNIWLAGNASAATLGVAIREVLLQPALQVQLRRGSRQLHQQHLNWDHIAANFISHTSNLAGSFD